MPVNIDIQYPANASAIEIKALEKHEATLKSKMVMLTNTTHEKYEWFHDDRVKSQKYFGLKCKTNQEMVFTKSLREISESTPDDFIFKIESDKVFENS